MKKIIINSTKYISFFAGIVLPYQSFLQADTLLVGWDFHQFATHGTTLMEGMGIEPKTEIISSHSDIGQTANLSFADFAPFDLIPNNNAAFGSVGTDSVNRIIDTDARNDPGNLLFNTHFERTKDSSAVAFAGTAAKSVTGLSFSINFSSANFSGIVITFAAEAQVGAPQSITWSYNIGNGAVSVGTTSGLSTTFQAFELDLSHVAELNNQASVTLLGTLGEGTQRNKIIIDNLQILATSSVSFWYDLADQSGWKWNGQVWIYDSHWPWIYMESETASSAFSGWILVESSIGSSNGYYGYSMEHEGWLWGNDSLGYGYGFGPTVTGWFQM